MYCPDYSAWTQYEEISYSWCQNICETTTSCQGISYGHVDNETWPECYFCNTHNLSPKIGVSFYKKPKGKDKLKLQKDANTVIKFSVH